MSYKLSLSAFLTLALSSTSALALTCANDYGGSDSCASNVTAAGDCETLGYATSDVAGCEHYLLCPFNQNYKRCVSRDYCRGYPLTECPQGAICSICGKENDYLYKLTGCKEGYVLSGNTCTLAGCDGYNLTSCPSKAECSTCLQGSVKKYKIDSCDEGYANTGKSCQKTYTRCCEAGFNFGRFTDAAYCDEDMSGTTDSNGAEISCAEVDIYLTNGTIKTCYQCQEERCDYNQGGDWECSLHQVCGSKCSAAVASCEAAGYQSTHPGSTYTCSSISVYLTSGNTAQCYYNCKLKPTSCSDAGYSPSDNCQYGSTTVSVDLRNGTTTTCYSCKSKPDNQAACNQCYNKCTDICRGDDSSNCSEWTACKNDCNRTYSCGF